MLDKINQFDKYYLGDTGENIFFNRFRENTEMDGNGRTSKESHTPKKKIIFLKTAKYIALILTRL